MYESFYGFREKPFHVTSDPSFLFPSRHHQEAMSHLVYGLRQRLGFMLITGEVGTGKTTLARSLLEKINLPARTALVLNPTLSGSQLLQAILKDFKVEAAAKSRGELLAAVERFLLETAQAEELAILLIDEAQALSTSALEQVRLLSTVETPKRKLLQIILIGQQELATRLGTNPKLRALRERIAVRYHMQPLDEPEIAGYIAHRLQVAGSATACFSPKAIHRIAQASGGIPRRINLLCDQSLMAGFARETRQIDEELVQEVLGIQPLVPIGGDP